MLCHVPHNHNDLALEVVKHRGIRALVELSLGCEGSAERDVDAACNVTSKKADTGVKETAFLFLFLFQGLKCLGEMEVTHF